MNCWTKDGLTRFAHYMQNNDEEVELANKLIRTTSFDVNMRDIGGRQG